MATWFNVSLAKVSLMMYCRCSFHAAWEKGLATNVLSFWAAAHFGSWIHSDNYIRRTHSIQQHRADEQQVVYSGLEQELARHHCRACACWLPRRVLR